MATAQRSEDYVYIYNLPYSPRKTLCDILDADRSWETLGGHLGYDMTTLILIGQAVYRDKSPTSELLNKFGERNGKIKHLFVLLYKMNHQRAMGVLQPYVEEKYHVLLRNYSNYSVSTLACTKKEEIPRPLISQLLQSSSTQNSSSVSSSHKCSQAKANGYSDVGNFNQQFSSLSLHSNRKLLNVTKEEAQYVKMPSNERKKHDSGCSKEESISDNCISQKIKRPENAWKHDKNPKVPSQHAYAISLSTQDDCLPDIMRIPYKEILQATNNFNKDLILGKGGFGTVYKGEWKNTSVAIKRLMPRQHNSQGHSQQLISLKQSLNELNVLKYCRIDNILPLYAVSLDGENPCLVYQLMVNGSLEDRLLLKNKTPPLNWSQRSHIAEGVTKGLNYLHTAPLCNGKPLCHGDIKSANILLDANMDAKIGDFGLTREGPGHEDTHVKVSSVHGTECYLPSEYLRNRHLSPQVDIFSYGIVLLEIATGLRPLDPKRTEGKRLADYVRALDKSGRWEDLRDKKAGEENMIWFRELIQIGIVCSSEEKKKRPPMEEVLEQFKKIKKGRFNQDQIRRLSVDKALPPNSTILAEISPLDLQKYWDDRPKFTEQNDVNRSTVPKEKIRSISEETDLTRQKNNIQCSASADESSVRDANSAVTPKPSASDRPVSPANLHDSGTQPGNVPNLTLLQLKVSEMSDTCQVTDSNSENYTYNSSSSLS